MDFPEAGVLRNNFRGLRHIHHLLVLTFHLDNKKTLVLFLIGCLQQ